MRFEEARKTFLKVALMALIAGLTESILIRTIAICGMVLGLAVLIFYATDSKK